MRNMIRFVFVLFFATAGYSALGIAGAHDYWTPVQKHHLQRTKQYLRGNNILPEVHGSSNDASGTSQNSSRSKQQETKKLDQSEQKKSVSPHDNEETEAEEEQLTTAKTSSCVDRAKSLEQNDEREKAILMLEKCVSEKAGDGNHSRVYYHLARLHDEKERLQHLKKFLASSPDADLLQKGMDLYSKMDSARFSLTTRLLYSSIQLLHKIVQSDQSRENEYSLANLNEMSAAVFRSSRPLLDSISYDVQSGNTLDVIGKKFGVGRGWINWVNRRSVPVVGNPEAKRLIAGESLLVFPGSLYLIVSISDARLFVFYLPEQLEESNETPDFSSLFPSLEGLEGNPYFVKSYRVGIGKPRKSPTPTGLFTFSEKTVHPDWTKPETGQVIPYGDPENILGTRWMGFSGVRGDGYGIHGTTEPETIGKKVSGGCIRMRNKNVNILFDFIPTYLKGLEEGEQPRVEVIK